MQKPGTGAIKTHIQTPKPKREIIKFTNSQNTKRTYGQLSEQFFPKRWPLSNPNRTKKNMEKHKVKRHRNSINQKMATENHNRTTALKRSVINCKEMLL